MIDDDERERKFECPECFEILRSAPGLGGHRWHAHGVAGKSQASRYRHFAQIERDEAEQRKSERKRNKKPRR